MNVPVTETQIFREEVDPNFPNLLDLARECPLVRQNLDSLQRHKHEKRVKESIARQLLHGEERLFHTISFKFSLLAHL